MVTRAIGSTLGGRLSVCIVNQELGSSEVAFYDVYQCLPRLIHLNGPTVPRLSVD